MITTLWISLKYDKLRIMWIFAVKINGFIPKLFYKPKIYGY